MADTLDLSADKEDENLSEKDSSDESTNSNPALNLSKKKQGSSQGSKAACSKEKQNYIEWKRRFRYLSYTHFLRHTRSINDKQTDEDLSPTKKKKREVLDCVYADDKGYLQGEIYEELESDEELGFSGDVCKKLNLMPSDLADNERHSEDIEAESLRTDLQMDSHIPEIIVVPSARFVRKIPNS